MTASVRERGLGVDVLMRRPVCVDDSLSVVARIAPLADMDVDLWKDRPCDESGDADERDQAANHARIMGAGTPRRQLAAPRTLGAGRQSWPEFICSSPESGDSLENVPLRIVMFFTFRSTHGTRHRSAHAERTSRDCLSWVEKARPWDFPIRASSCRFLAIHRRGGDHAGDFRSHPLQRALTPVRQLLDVA
jgi:hypothetical protein